MPGHASWLMACVWGILAGDIPEGQGQPGKLATAAPRPGVVKRINLCFMMLEADTTENLVWIEMGKKGLSDLGETLEENQ